MVKDKIETLLGFAVKADKLIYGIDNILTLKKKRYLYIKCLSAGNDTSKKLKNIADLGKIPIITTEKLLEDIVFKTNVKVIALSDKQMSEAILNNLNDHYQLYVAEVK